MKKRTKILSLLSSFALSANLLVCSPVSYGFFEKAVTILKTNKDNLTTQQIDELKNTFRKEQASFQEKIADLRKMIEAMKEKPAGISGSFSKLQQFSKDLHVHMDPFNPDMPLTNEKVTAGLAAMQEFGLSAPNYDDFVNLVNKVNEETVIYFPTLCQILKDPAISTTLQTTKDLNILRKEIKKTIADNKDIMGALKLNIEQVNSETGEIEFFSNWTIWDCVSLNPTEAVTTAVCKGMAEMLCKWNEKNLNSIKNWWVSRYERTRNEIKKMAYDESNGKWETEDKEVIDVLFMCLDSYVK